MCIKMVDHFEQVLIIASLGSRWLVTFNYSEDVYWPYVIIFKFWSCFIEFIITEVDRGELHNLVYGFQGYDSRPLWNICTARLRSNCMLIR